LHFTGRRGDIRGELVTGLTSEVTRVCHHYIL